jgi:hypothetical protein
LDIVGYFRAEVIAKGKGGYEAGLFVVERVSSTDYVARQAQLIFTSKGSMTRILNGVVRTLALLSPFPAADPPDPMAQWAPTSGFAFDTSHVGVFWT